MTEARIQAVAFDCYGTLVDFRAAAFAPAPHPPAAGRNRSFGGPLPPFRPYREEWPEHFAICFEELGAKGDPLAAYESLRHILCAASAFPESRRVVERLGGRLPLALLSNADDDFLL